jgi:hypothetical protein
VLADGPLAYYRLDEPAGSGVALDSSGRGQHGSYGARVGRAAPGLLAGDGDGAASFAGGPWSLDGIVSVPRSLGLEPSNAVSLELWMRPLLDNADLTSLVDYGDASNLNHQSPYGVLLFAHAFAVYLFTTVGSAGTTNFLTVTQPVPQHIYHYVQTYDGTNIRMYVNGVLEAQKPFVGPLVGYGAAGLGIGGTPAGGINDLVFAGTLDEVAIYGAALTPQQVMAHYAAGTRPPR